MYKKREYPAMQFYNEELKGKFYQTIGERYVSNKNHKRRISNSIFGIEVFVSLAKPTSFEDIQTIIDEFLHYPNIYEIYDNVFTPYEMGKYIVSVEILNEQDVENYIDYKAIGELTAIKENGIYTEYGYILYKGINNKMLDIFQHIKKKYPLK